MSDAAAEFDCTYLSFGAGTQSSALLVLSALGWRDAPRADFAVFADTQSEPPWVYEHLGVMRDWAEEHGMPIIVATRGNLGADAIKKADGEAGRGGVASLPLWTRGEDGREAPTPRQCTRSYKIEVCERAVRERLGYKPRQRMRHRVRNLLGISWDERQRCKKSSTAWIACCYPLVEQRISVEGCKDVLRRVGLPVPRKSACTFCPYHSDAHWAELEAHEPEVFAQACEFDRAIRDQSRSGMKNETFLHRSLTPLEMVVFDSSRDQKAIPAVGLFDNFANECDGMCGV